MAKTKILNLRIDADLKKEIKKLAEEDGRSVSNWVTYLIKKEVKKARKVRTEAQQEAVEQAESS